MFLCTLRAPWGARTRSNFYFFFSLAAETMSPVDFILFSFAFTWAHKSNGMWFMHVNGSTATPLHASRKSLWEFNSVNRINVEENRNKKGDAGFIKNSFAFSHLLCRSGTLHTSSHCRIVRGLVVLKRKFRIVILLFFDSAGAFSLHLKVKRSHFAHRSETMRISKSTEEKKYEISSYE